MKKITLIIIATLFLTGCASSGTSFGGVLKSKNAGIGWEGKNKIDEKKNISKTNVLSIAVDSFNPGRVYIGTAQSGIFVSNDWAENWKKINYPPSNVYGLVVSKQNSEIIYATGSIGGRGKIFKTNNAGQDWQEIYTEPTDATIVTSLAINPGDDTVLYAGTSGGVIIRSNDGGESWENVFLAKGAITKISFDSNYNSAVYFLSSGKNIFVSRDQGGSFVDIKKNLKENIKTKEKEIQNELRKILNTKFSTIESDPYHQGILYLGTNEGMFKLSNFGQEIEEVNIIGSSKLYPIQSIAISPSNSNEIVYGSAQAIYRSKDSGKNWSTFQLKGKSIIRIIKFDNNDTSIVYSGLGKQKSKGLFKP